MTTELCPAIVSHSRFVSLAGSLWEWAGAADPRIRCFAVFRRETWAIWNFVEILEESGGGYMLEMVIVSWLLLILTILFCIRRWGCLACLKCQFASFFAFVIVLIAAYLFAIVVILIK